MTNLTYICRSSVREGNKKIASLVQKEYKIPLSCVRLYMNVVLSSMECHRATVESIKVRERKTVRRGGPGTYGRGLHSSSLEALAVAVGVLPLHPKLRKGTAMY